MMPSSLLKNLYRTEKVGWGLEPLLDAAMSLMAPITGTILTTMVAFSPIIMVDGDISDWFFSVPVIIIAALAISWLECFFILPIT